MDRREFLTRLEKRCLPSVLLFEGEEAWLKQSAVEALRSAYLPQGLEDLNETRMEDPETDELIAAVETVPFMAEKRLILVRDYPALTGRRDADERLIAYLPQVPSTAILLFDCAQKPDARKKLYASIKKLDGIVSFSALKGRELTAFVTSAFRERGKTCDERTAEYLVFTSGSDTARLLTEIEKISSLHPEAEEISPADVRMLAIPSVESTVFQMVDAVVAGQDARAFSLLRIQLKSGENRVAILAMLLRQFRLMQHVKIMQYERKTEKDILSALGMGSYIGGQYIRQASAWTNGQIKQAVKLCLDTDLEIKSGELNQEGALEAVMLKLLLLKKGG